MSDDVQQRIDEFAHRLEALNAEFEELKRDAVGDAVSTPPVPPLDVAPPTVPVWLRDVDGLFRAGHDRKALRAADSLHSRAVARSSTLQLTTLLAYLQQVHTTERGRLARLVFMVERSLQFIEPAAAIAEPEGGPRPPFPART